ncbi:hypothetical protein [Pontibacter rugosus]|uniref:Uncharacterized protein n=1 Tax=Pontibacter rugosus TaxID=1745966 RepID=A0ABW3SRX5_9BACT
MNGRKYKGTIVWLILGAVGYISVELMIFNSDKITNYSLCDDEETVRAQFWSGVIDSKYLDSLNHNYKTLRITGELNSHYKTYLLILTNDESGLYEYISEGDSILKQLDSLKAKVVHDTVNKEFIIDMGCAE